MNIIVLFFIFFLSFSPFFMISEVLTISHVIGVTICNDGRIQSDIDPRNTSSQRFLRAARPVGRPKHSNPYGPAPAADYVVKNNLVDVDQDLQKAVPDSDYYCFDGDRGKEKIKPNQVHPCSLLPLRISF